MSVKKEVQKAPPNQMVVEEKVVGFNAARMQAPFLLRLGAVIIDYISVIFVPVICFMVGRILGYDGSKLLNSEIINIGWLFTILFIVTNLLIFPIFAGQSVGKMLTGVRIAKDDGTLPGFSTIAIRHLIGYPLTIMSLGLGYVIALFTINGKALHDFLAGTVVVYGKHKVKQEVVGRKSLKSQRINKPQTT